MTREVLATATDEQLTVAYQESGDNDIFEELLRRYKGHIYKAALKIMPRGDFGQEDAVQEMVIKFLSAVETFDPAKGKMITHALKCFHKQYVNIIRHRNRDCRKGKEIYLDEERFDETAASMMYTLASTTNIEKDYEIIEACRNFLGSRLTGLEGRVAFLLSCGYLYGDVAKVLGCSWKAVDNARQRVRKKLSA